MENDENYYCDKEVKIYNSFDDMELPDNLLRGVYGKGWEKPSPIQARAVVLMKDGHEIIAQSQSGTGKTGAFTIGALTQVDPTKKDTQVLILSHTRELADQITTEIKGLARWMDINIYCAAGGRDIKTDIATLRGGVQILVGTPGRVFDLIERGVFRTETIKLIILDELDNLLGDTFRMQIINILRHGFTEDTKICMFSATLTIDILDFVKPKLIKDPITILVNKERLTLEGITQYYIDPQWCSTDKDKLDALIDIYKCMNVSSTIVFVNQKEKAQWLAEQLRLKDFSVGFIHGGLSDVERREMMTKFKGQRYKVLVSTDLCARGIDIQQVGMVFNFEMPIKREDYLHRIGRSGRFGRKGVAINLVNEQELANLRNVEVTYNTIMHQLPEDLSSLNSRISTE